MPKLNELTVIVTGAGRGMGRAIAKMLVAEGATVALNSLDSDALEACANELRRNDVRIFAQAADVTREDQVSNFFDSVQRELGGADVLLNIPGLSVPGPIAEMDLADYQKVFDVNMMGSFLCSKHFLSRVDADRGGLIVNFSSMAGKRANPNSPIYCAAKAALDMFGQCMALQTVSKNVRVTTLNPGATATDFWAGRKVPLDKFMQSEDIAETVRFLLQLPPRLVVHEMSFESFDFIRSKV
ncbi:MAG: SDR family oxidoreductase [Pirellulales bacterium]|nr:SDR family oxidoreductase [Pirellulales bacterium]